MTKTVKIEKQENRRLHNQNSLKFAADLHPWLAGGKSKAERIKTQINNNLNGNY